MPSQSTRRVIESFQTGQALKKLFQTGQSTAPGGLTSAPSGSSYDEIRAFEQKINAPDYPKELRELYYVAKSKNDYTPFNEAVTKHNETLKAQNEATQKELADFESKVNAPDYPTELKTAYKEAKAKNDYTEFNQAVESYNARKKTEYDKQTAISQTQADQYANAMEYARTNPQAKPGIVLTPEQIAQLETEAQYLTPASPEAAAEFRSYIDEQKRLNTGVIAVGPGGQKQEYISKFDYDKIAAADKANNTNFLEILKDTGLSGLNAAVGKINQDRQQNYDTWLKENIKSDPYLNSVLLSKGEAAAIAAYDKRYADLQAIYERSVLPKTPKEYQAAYRKGDMAELSRLEAQYTAEYKKWIDENIKADKYLNGVYLASGEAKALEAWQKRQNDLQGISDRQQAAYNEAFEKIKPYGSVDQAQIMKARTPEHVAELLQKQSFDVRKYIAENPNQEAVRVLRTLKFPESTIKEAQNYVNGVDAMIADINKDPRTWDDKFSTGSTAILEARKLGLLDRNRPGVMVIGDKLASGVYYRGGDTITDFDKFWGSLTKNQKEQLAGAISVNPNKDVDFAAIMERYNANYDKLPAAVQFAIPFIPFIGMPSLAFKAVGSTVAKKMTGQEVSGMEYAVDAATVVFAGLQGGKVVESLFSKTLGKAAAKVAAKKALKAGEDILGTQAQADLALFKAEVGATLAAKIGEKAVTGAAMGVFIKNLADTWQYMTPGERATNLGMLALPFAAGGARQLQFLKTIASDGYIPFRSMSREAPTSRVTFTPEKIARLKKEGFTDADIIKAGDSINTQLASGKKVATVKLGSVTVKLRNVPYQQVFRRSFFNSSPDGTLLDRGGSVPVIKDFYSAFKVAIEPLQRSYLEGRRATKPTINELIIDDPAIMAEIAPQRRLIEGGKTLEPESVILSRDALAGKGYRLVPIEGKAGYGVTSDASVGEVQIRRYRLAKVTGNENGLVQVKTGQYGDGGNVGVGDLHATNKFRKVFDDINTSYGRNVLEGVPDNPDTWHLTRHAKNRTITFLGDSIDRGTQYETWRKNINRLQDEANTAKKGDKVVRLLGNHELAYLADDAISGIEYTDATRAAIKKGLLEDIKAGRVQAAYAKNGKLYTHAGVSTGLFSEYKGKTPEYIAKDLNRRFLKAVKTEDYSDKMFAKGRVEKGHSLLKNERDIGGIFWHRPQESTQAQLDLGFPQIVGHNPGTGVRRIWGENFYEADVGRKDGGTGVYADTPAVKTVPVEILVEEIAGTAPNFKGQKPRLALAAMRDTVADFVLGWDGRSYAIKSMVSNRMRMADMLKELDRQIAARRAKGDTYGAAFLSRTKEDLTNPTLKDYYYGDVGFWRDIVMGRQNSVKVSDSISRGRPVNTAQAVATLNRFRNQISSVNSADAARVFGRSKSDILKDTDIAGERSLDNIQRKLLAMRDIVDEGLDREIVEHLDRDQITRQYGRLIQERLNNLTRYRDPVYEADTGRVIERTPRTPETRTYSRIPEARQTRTPEAAQRGKYAGLEGGRTPVQGPPQRTPAGPPQRVPTPTPPDRTPSPSPPPRTPVPPPPDTPIPPPPPTYRGRGRSDDVSRRIIKNAGGAVAINMGEVGAPGKRKRVWDVVTRDYSGNENYYRVLGDAPAGATILRKGKGSAYATAQMLTGEPPKKPVTIDKGFMDVELSAEGRTITARFKPDPKGLTRGDIQAGEHKTPPITPRMPPISGRSPRIGGKTPRITPKVPRITPKTPRIR